MNLTQFCEETTQDRFCLCKNIDTKNKRLGFYLLINIITQ